MTSSNVCWESRLWAFFTEDLLTCHNILVIYLVSDYWLQHLNRTDPTLAVFETSVLLLLWHKACPRATRHCMYYITIHWKINFASTSKKCIHRFYYLFVYQVFSGAVFEHLVHVFFLVWISLKFLLKSYYQSCQWSVKHSELHKPLQDAIQIKYDYKLRLQFWTENNFSLSLSPLLLFWMNDDLHVGFMYFKFWKMLWKCYLTELYAILLIVMDDADLFIRYIHIYL